MNPMVATTAVGDLATKWRRSAAVTIAQPVAVTIAQPVAVTTAQPVVVTTVQPVVVASMLTDPRLHLARCRQFRRVRVRVARDHLDSEVVQTLAFLHPRNSVAAAGAK
jgi:hypothetical protein